MTGPAEIAEDAATAPALPVLPPLPPLRVLYLGDRFVHGTSYHRYRALCDLGCAARLVEPAGASRAARCTLWPRLVGRLFRHGVDCVPTPDPEGVNRALHEHAAGGERFDILWLDRALAVQQETLERFRAAQPGCRIVGYSPDDMGRRHNLSRAFLHHLPLYDLYFTTKSYNVTELLAAGARRVEWLDNAFDLYDHRPLPAGAAERARLAGAVGFIGSYERARAQSMRRLAAAGIPLRVWGNRWRRMGRPPAGMRVEYRDLVGDDYATALGAFDINLCFLRKANRDRQTTRTMEIPACGGFMLAERTDEQRRLFREGVEAEFFGDDRELLDKVRYYSSHPEARRRIAEAGRQRCLADGYSNHHRVHHMLSRVVALRRDGADSWVRGSARA